MRKRYKKKKISCWLCKPYKMCGEHRWTVKEMEERTRHEKEICQILRREV